MNGFAQLEEMKRRIRTLRSLRGSVVAAAAPALTAELRAAHAAGVTPDGASYGTNTDGSSRTLRRSGALAASLRVEQDGAGLRAVVGASYGRFHASKLLPSAGLPVKWAAELQRVAALELGVRTGGKQ